MKKKKLIWQLYPSYLLITLISLVAVTWYATGSLRNFFLDQSATDLESRAHLIQKQIFHFLSPLDESRLDQFCKEIGTLSNTRITVILPNGQVIADSEERVENMDNHGDRSEIRSANSGETGKSIRFSRTLNQKMMYVAIPLVKDKIRLSVLRVSIPVTSIDIALEGIQEKIILGGLLIALIATGVSLYISRRITKPIEEMKQGAERFAEGHLSHRLVEPPAEELSRLAEAMNQMAFQLDGRIKTVINQRNELKTILSSMIEGVLAVDMDERMMSINHAAIKILEIDSENIQGKGVQEIIRNHTLERFIIKALGQDEPMIEDITHFNKGERVLNLRSSPLVDSGNQQVGTVIVLNDVTQLRRLENMRRDFVANVSHEIKTPLTAVKGFVETIIEGGVTDAGERDRFLGIILKHVNRLNTIIKDLLLLSKIEQEKMQEKIHLEKGNIKNVIQTAVQVCQVKAADRNVAIETRVDKTIRANIEPTLLEQAMINLIDNAVKYSHPGGRVEIITEQNDSENRILIQDQGPGIHAKHLPRLFERFYRVDKARSRKQGGTGLGLAIVKHIIQAHSGRVTVESEPGKGSVFTIHLPRTR